ncbi:DMT family transporter [Alloalcanivorax mobilis]|uniref:DMT family transporter n=1 Tax=Alloalcanivorax mobilis TaxID=2019569 RepID=UPI000B5B1861|nr:DMT family transporter [Alloalcanivorax mobilis]ASK33920.1 EamA family transporter [Alcanivorax sp. N3-2A]
MKADQPLKGALLLILGEGLLAVMAALIKHLSETLPTETIVFGRNLVGLVVLIPVLMVSGGIRDLGTRHLRLHFVRGFTGVAAMFCFFYTIGHIQLAEAVLVKMTVPFFLPLVAWLWLREGLSPRTALAILLGFVGVGIIMRADRGVIEPVMLVALAGAAIMSVAKVSIRRMAVSEPPHRVVFYFSLFATLFSALSLLWHRDLPSLEQMLWLLAIGSVAIAGQFAMTTAYQIARPGQVGVYNYAAVIWAAFMGWLFWGETLALSTLLGTLLVIGAGVWNLKSR